MVERETKTGRQCERRADDSIRRLTTNRGHPSSSTSLTFRHGGGRIAYTRLVRGSPSQRLLFAARNCARYLSRSLHETGAQRRPGVEDSFSLFASTDPRTFSRANAFYGRFSAPNIIPASLHYASLYRVKSWTIFSPSFSAPLKRAV